jgi:hypothetical protein
MNDVLDSGRLMLAIDNDAARLDELEKLLDQSVDALDQTEERWLEVRDAVADDLKDEMEKQGRKGDPAEHWIDAQARKSNRVAFTNYRRAKRAVDKCQIQVQAKRAAMNGRQSNLKALADEARAQPYQPAPSGKTFGERWKGAA